MKLQSVMHSFNRVPSADIQRSSFDRSHGYKTTFDAGYLIPIYVDEALPGDTFNLNMTGFARLATPLDPIMDNMYIETFFFAVPNRLLWDNWEKFNGAQDNPDDSTDFLIPQMVSPSGGHLVGSLSDYFGIPTGVANLSHSSLWHRAYNLIYNEWFRDENLQDSLVVDKDDGPDASTDYVLKRRGKRQDYFTGCLPWPQKGDAVQIPLGTRANVLGIGPVDGSITPSTGTIRQSDGSNLGASTTLTTAIRLAVTGTSPNIVPNIYADLTDATAATVNELRQAFQVQKMLERDARGGTRYVELLKSHFGVTSPDFRLQRPEYLGGGSTPVSINPIAQTSATGLAEDTTPQGNLAAFGTALAYGHGFTYSSTEHGVIIGMVAVRADLTYQQGLERDWFKRTKVERFWPDLALLGEQSVLRREIFLTATEADNDIVFGYQERYAEYRYKQSLITGLFRSDATGTLDVWHLSEDFAAAPTLGDDFISAAPPVDRVVQVPTQPHFYLDSFFSCKAARPMPLFGVVATPV